MVDTKHRDSEESFEKEHSHRKNQIRDMAMLEQTGKGSGLDTLSEEQEDSHLKGRNKKKLETDEVKHH